jgi:hypothetical protein
LSNTILSSWKMLCHPKLKYCAALLAAVVMSDIVQLTSSQFYSSWPIQMTTNVGSVKRLLT